MAATSIGMRVTLDGQLLLLAQSSDQTGSYWYEGQIRWATISTLIGMRVIFDGQLLLLS